MQVDDMKLLRLDVLDGLLEQSVPYPAAGMYRAVVEDYRKLLHIAALVLDSYEHESLRLRPVAEHDEYDAMVGPRWSALRQLVTGDKL